MGNITIVYHLEYVTQILSLRHTKLIWYAVYIHRDKENTEDADRQS